MRNHIVIDLETLDTARTAAFISIGAVRVNIFTGEILDEFYANIEMGQAKAYGSTSVRTINWWKEQSKEAREAVLSNPQDLPATMYDFACWINNNDRVWGNGAIFDIGILEHYYESTNSGIPWKFWNVRDVRTIKEVGIEMFGYNDKTIEFVGEKHNALDDAIHEAKLISWVYQQIAKARKSK